MAHYRSDLPPRRIHDTLVGVNFDVEFGKEELTKIEQTNVHVAAMGVFEVKPDGGNSRGSREHEPLDDFFNELRREWLLCLVMT